jgi:hypothetical protein
MQSTKEIIIKTTLFLAKGKLIMWAYTINMIVLSWYATLNEVKIDSSIPAMYMAALTAYVGSKGYEFYHAQKNSGLPTITGPAGGGVD